MPSASIRSKGQITIPASVRKAMQVEAGDRVQFIELKPGRYELVAATQPVTTLKGMFGKRATPVTLKQMNAAIAAADARAMIDINTNVAPGTSCKTTRSCRRNSHE